MDAQWLWPGEETWSKPLAFVELDKVDLPLQTITLPPCPVIGIGDEDHPLAEQLDAVIAAPITAEALAQQVEAVPRSAATIVQLLRILPGLSREAGLTAESFAYAMLQGSDEHREWMSRQPARETTSPGEGRIGLAREHERLIITLDRPEAGNAIDRIMRDGLYEAFSLAVLDPEITTVSLRAGGKVFSLGADLGEFGTTVDPATAHAIRMQTLPARMVIPCAHMLDVHINGACIGAGLEIAAFARRVTASSRAWFQLPELAMGMLPGAGGCVSLTRRIGRQRAALMILSGKRLSARHALDWGLVDAIVDDPA